MTFTEEIEKEVLVEATNLPCNVPPEAIEIRGFEEPEENREVVNVAFYIDGMKYGFEITDEDDDYPEVPHLFDLVREQVWRDHVLPQIGTSTS